MSFLRKLAALLALLLVASMPVASVGGDGGLVNLPGGGGRSARQTIPTTENMILSLPLSMWGSVAYIHSYPCSTVTVMQTTSGLLVIPSNVMEQLIASGVRGLGITFVAPTGARLCVEVIFNPEEQTATILVTP